MRSLFVVLIPLLLAGCPKGGGAADPKEVEQPDEPPVDDVVEEPVAVNDPELVCAGPDSDRVVFTLDLVYPEGCPVIPSEMDGEIHDLELEVSGTPPKPLLADPVDLGTKTYVWASAGCGARIQFVGPIGTLDLAFAATGSSWAAGTATWTPTGGAPCDLTLEGAYTDYAKSDPADEW